MPAHALATLPATASGNNGLLECLRKLCGFAVSRFSGNCAGGNGRLEVRRSCIVFFDVNGLFEAWISLPITGCISV